MNLSKGQYWDQSNPASTKRCWSSGMWRIHFDDRKGADASEWPHDLRVRELPEWMGGKP
jgi:hypothetical protein